jgi:IPT/TIG domain
MTPPVSTTPVFSMPAIGPPPSGTTPSAWYATVAAATTLTATGVAHDGLEISISNPAYAGLLAMAGGLVGYIPPGSALPTDDLAASPGGGSVVLQTGPLDAAALKGALPPGVVPMTVVLYLDVQPATVRTALAPLVDKLPDSWLQANWDQAFTTTDHKVLAARYLERLMLGQVSVFAPGGTGLGQAAVTGSSGPARFTLRLLDGAGNNLSPVLHLRTMAAWAGTSWSGHPLVAAVSNVTVPVNLWVAFEIWKEKDVYERLPAGIDVDLVDYDAIGPNDVRATAATDASGVAQFFFSSMDALSHDNDLFFVAHTKGKTVAGRALPDEWSTRGWAATDGTPGYYPSFAGAQLGDATHPVVFRIGVDVHVKYQYPDRHRPNELAGKPTTGPLLDAPKGTKVLLRTRHPPGQHGEDLDDDVLELTLDDKGEASGFTFKLEGGETLYWLTRFEIEDASAGITLSKVQYTSWSTREGGDGPRYPDNQSTSLGQHLKPELVTSAREAVAASFFVLKTLREFSILFYELSGHDWTGVGLSYDTLVLQLPFSWPAGYIHFNEPYWLDRWTVFHETAHQIMWSKVTSFSSLGVAYQELNPRGDLFMTHDIPVRTTAQGALVEGWAEFVEQLFDSGGKAGAPPWPIGALCEPEFPLSYKLISPLTRLRTLPTPSSAVPAPPGTGELVEGAFANGLWQVVVDLVDTSGNAASQVAFTPDGNIKALPKLGWISDPAAQARFQKMIWEPLKALSSHADPTTTAYLSEMKRLNPGEWHLLLDALQRWDLAMHPPTAAAPIAPASGPSAGGTTVTITGGDFAAKSTTVTIGGKAATTVNVSDHTSLTAVTPAGTAGARDVAITTPGGTVTLAGAFTYT